VAESRRFRDYQQPGVLAAEAIASGSTSEPDLKRELAMALSTPPGRGIRG